MPFVTFEIDGEKVIGEPVLADDDDPFSFIVGVKLIGPKEYNGHIHGWLQDAHLCIPNVVDSVARMALACPDSPLLGEFMYAAWYD